jgi:hypothetical protein
MFIYAKKIKKIPQRTQKLLKLSLKVVIVTGKNVFIAVYIPKV